MIRQWLEADRTAPRKQRHTSRRIWQRPRDEYGATVSESTVRHYVACLRRDLQPETSPVFFDLVFDPGEAAQVDWGEARIVVAGQESTAQILAALPSAQAAGCFEAEALNRRLSSSVPADRTLPEPAHVPAGPPVFQPHPRLYNQLTEEA